MRQGSIGQNHAVKAFGVRLAARLHTATGICRAGRHIPPAILGGLNPLNGGGEPELFAQIVAVTERAKVTFEFTMTGIVSLSCHRQLTKLSRRARRNQVRRFIDGAARIVDVPETTNIVCRFETDIADTRFVERAGSSQPRWPSTNNGNGVRHPFLPRINDCVHCVLAAYPLPTSDLRRRRRYSQDQADGAPRRGQPHDSLPPYPLSGTDAPHRDGRGTGRVRA